MSQILATKKQVDYMLMLFNDLGYGTRAQIKGWLEKRKVRVTLGLGDLTIGEACRILDLLKVEKEEGREYEDRMSEVDVETEEFWRD